MDVRAEIFIISEILSRVQRWFHESQALKIQIQRSDVLLFLFENETDILLISPEHREKGLPIGSVEKKGFGIISNVKENQLQAEQKVPVHGDRRLRTY